MIADSTKIEILENLNGKKREKQHATEVMAQAILQEEWIKTIRDDKIDEIWIYRDGVYVPNGISYLKEYCREVLGKAYDVYVANNVLNKIKVDTLIDAKDFFNQNNHEEIAVNNGILNLKTGKLSDFSPDKIFFQKIKVNYVPNADCPKIKEHLAAVLKNAEEDSKIFFEIVGWCLYKKYVPEKAIMGTGCGRNGKSKTWELVKNFLGEGNVSSVPLQELDVDGFAASNLLNKLANIAPDLPSVSLESTSTFKSLTGQDYVSANRKFLPRIDFKNYAKLIFSCNQLPITEDITPAFWNRWVILEFPFTFISQKEFNLLSQDEKDKGNYKLANPFVLDGLLAAEELSGLLNNALEGLARLLRQGDFSSSKSVKDIQTLWTRKADSFAAFYEDCCEEKDNRLYASDLQKSYISYCKKYKVKPALKKHIRLFLEQKGIFPAKNSAKDDLHYGKWFWDGLNVVPDKNDPDNQK